METKSKHWKQTTLEEVADIVGGGTPSTKESLYWNGDIPWITPKDLSNYNSVWIERGGKSITQIGFKNSSARLLPPNSILFSSRAPIGYIVINKIPVTTNQGFKSLIPKDNVDYRFLYYWLTANKNRIEGQASGSTFAEVSGSVMKKISIFLPPLSEQKSIASVLSSLDDKIELLRDQNQTLEEMAQRLFKEWFVDFNFPSADGRPYKASGGQMVESEMGEIPEGWQTKSYSDLVNVLSGGTPKTDVVEYWNGQIPFFTPKDAKDTFYVDTTEKYITEAGLSACNSKLYTKDTVFITARGTVGKCALALRDMAMNQSCYALVGKDISNLFVFLLTKQLIDVIKKSASGAVFDAITVSTFNSLHVVLGDRQVTDRFEALIRPMFNKIANNTEEIFKLAELRDQLLPKLMSGEIVLDRE